MTKTEERYYRALRTTWELPAGLALRYAKAYTWCKEAGITFEWSDETESPIDVFGAPDPVNGPFYDAEAEFECLLARAPAKDCNCPGEVLDSLGMIDGAHKYTDYRGYWFLCECEMSSQAKATMLAMYE